MGAERILCFSLFVCGLLTTTASFKRVCYYKGWAPLNHDAQATVPEEIDPHVCTHILYSFGQVDSTGRFIHTREGYDLGYMQRLVKLKQKNPDLKIMLAIGGWSEGSDGFKEAVSSDYNMQAFADNAVSLLRGLGFDGLDLDWEYPADRGSPAKDKDGFSRWLQIIQGAFMAEAVGSSKDKLLLSVAAAPAAFRVQISYNITMISQYSDFINLMMYNFHGSWENTVNVQSALYSDNEEIYLANLAKYWASQGADKDKLVIGAPLYGNLYHLADPNNTAIGAPHTGNVGFLPYYEICRLLEKHNITEIMLPTERVPYLVYNGQWMSYDNQQSLHEKAQYVRDNGYGGVMVWSVDMDDATGACNQGSWPLMKALISGLSSDGGSPMVG